MEKRYAVLHTIYNSGHMVGEGIVKRGTLQECAEMMRCIADLNEQNDYTVRRVPEQAKVVCVDGYQKLVYECVRA